MPELPTEACELATRQFGAITRQQLQEWLTLGQVDGLVRRGRLVPGCWGVYRVAGGAEPREHDAMVAALRTTDARVAGPFVGGLFRTEGLAVTDPFVLLTPAGRRPRWADFDVFVDPAPGQHDATWSGALPIVAPTLNAIILADPRVKLPDQSLRVAVDSMRWARQTTTDRLRELATQLLPHRGAGRILDLLADGSLVAESERERHLGRLLDRITPPPRRQAEVLGYRPDFLWAAVRYIVEYDGQVHDRPERRSRDDRRDQALEEAGYKVCRVRDADLRDPDRLLQRVLATLRQRAEDLDLPAATFTATS